MNVKEKRSMTTEKENAYDKKDEKRPPNGSSPRSR